MPDNLWIAWPDKGSDDKSEVRSILTEEYRDHGAWARHYSTVRMTLGTFFLSAATGVIYARWDKPELKTFLLALFVLTVGVVLFIGFSRLTFQEMNRQRKIVKAYREKYDATAGAPRELSEWWEWSGGRLCAIVVLLFLLLDVWWWRSSQPNPGKTTEIRVPITVQIGDSAPAAIQLPVKIAVPAPPGQ